ncbi:MAG: RNA polymerase sigma factor SigJ [Myxococcota bacterium]
MATQRTAIFEQHRRTLEGIAYRMLGTRQEAQDAVQETYLRWHQVEVAELDNARAWLMTVCSRIALNQLQSARKQREVYVGEWLPEPFPDQPGDDPGVAAEINDSISVALMHALETLSPVERAVFLLHDVFDLSFDEVAAAVGKNSANCRQLAARARKRVRAQRPRFQTTPEEHRRLLEGFIEAARESDKEKLISLLSPGVELHSDGGGRVEALPHVLRGAHDVAGFLAGVFARLRRQGVATATRCQRFNGAPGVLLFEDESLATAFTIDVDDGRICRIYALRNPDKLGGFRS